MSEFYPAIKLIHVAAALASGTLFALRGAAVQAGGRWAMAAPLRFLSYTIDTVLLGAALLLVIILPAAVYANGWLAVKLVLLVAYIVAGSFALKRGRTPRTRRWCFAIAAGLFVGMLAIARTHSPLGPWLWLRAWFG